MSYAYDAWGRPYNVPPPPMPPQNNYKAEMDAIWQKMKDLEARNATGFNQNIPTQTGYGYGSNVSQNYNQAPPPPIILVNNEDEITPHITNYEFIMSGKKLHFYNSQTNEYITAFHDASLPRTIKRRYKEATDEEIVVPTESTESTIYERFDRIENEILTIKAMLENATGVSEADNNNDKPIETNGRDNKGRFTKKG